MANLHPYSSVLSPLVLPNGVVLKNRLTASASTNNMFQADCADWPRDAIMSLFIDRAKSGAAMVTVTGTKDKGNYDFYRNVFHDPKWTLFDLSSPTTQVLFAQMAECVHMYDSKLMLQLIPKATNDYDVSGGDTQLNFGNFQDMPTTRELTGEQLEELKESQIQWADYARHAGFDGVVIHMCYRFSTAARMLSLRTNHRTDEYGGSLENRCRWPLEICKGIKERCGRKFIVEVVLSGHDPEPDGWTTEDSVAFARLAEGYVDMIQVRNPEIDPSHPTSYQAERYPNLAGAAAISAGIKAQGIHVAVETIGGYTDPDVMEGIIKDGKADIIAAARLWISNPGIGELLKEGNKEDIVPCIRCYKCLHRNVNAVPQIACCAVNPEWGLETRLGSMFAAPKRRKKVAVVGGGPAGMKAALLLAKRGHDVALYEKTGRLGGLLNATNGVPFKWSVNDYKNWLIEQIRKNDNIHVLFNTAATAEMLRSAGYEAVLIGIGSSPVVPRIPGIEHARDAVGVFEHEDEVPDNVVIIGGGEVGVDAGMHLAGLGRSVTVIELTGMLCSTANIVHTYSHIENYWKGLPTFHYRLNAQTTEVTRNSVKYRTAGGPEQEIQCDMVLYSVGLAPKKQEALDLFDPKAYESFLIGDCGSYGGDIQRCNRSAFGAASCV